MTFLSADFQQENIHVNSKLSGRAVQVLVAALIASQTAHAENINVSKIVTGTLQNVNWTASAKLPMDTGTATYNYSTREIAGISAENSTYYQSPPWTPAWLSSSPQLPKLERSQPTPATSGNVSYASNVYQDASVNLTAAPGLAESRIFKSGSAQALANLSVHLVHTAAQPADYFVTVYVPKFTITFDAAYSIWLGSDDNGGTYDYMNPEQLRMRTAADLYVNGLPVWSSEQTYRYPEDNASSPWDKVETFWGRYQASNSDLLYLGRLKTGDSLTLSLAARGNVVSKAPDCGTEYGGYPFDPYQVIHCADASASVSLPGAETGTPGFTVFAKQPPKVRGL